MGSDLHIGRLYNSPFLLTRFDSKNELPTSFGQNGSYHQCDNLKWALVHADFVQQLVCSIGILVWPWENFLILCWKGYYKALVIICLQKLKRWHFPARRGNYYCLFYSTMIIVHLCWKEWPKGNNSPFLLQNIASLLLLSHWQDFST